MVLARVRLRVPQWAGIRPSKTRLTVVFSWVQKSDSAPGRDEGTQLVLREGNKLFCSCAFHFFFLLNAATIHYLLVGFFLCSSATSLCLWILNNKTDIRTHKNDHVLTLNIL